MIRLVGDIINKATKLKKSQDTLPSALIVGGAGSGKNNIIEFLKIFSNSYFNGTTHYINMAGIKPDADVSSILMGTTDITKKYPGMFSAIRKETMGKIKKLKKGKEVDGINIYPTLILDEFNSLNIESQGILLRFIENSEIIKMGAIRDDLVNNQIICNNFLIIGIMNEDPDDLSREKAIEFITKNEYISGLVGDLFYEQIMKIRRLRPDIKYRMIKSGKFEIPNLKNRKFDIPILFYLFINGEIKQKGREVFISLNALDKLISPYIEWPGNIRQLQALAKIVCEFIPQSELNPQNRDCIIIKENYIDSAIKVMGLN
jgi:DNA-binding NtrC family response regulator